MTKGNVSQLMEKGFRWLYGNRADGDLPATLGVALGVAVEVLERDTLDVQRGKRSLFVPFRDRRRLVFRTIGLPKNEPF